MKEKLEAFSIADLVLINGNVITLNPAQPKAKWIAIANGKIVALGSKNNIQTPVAEDTKIIDCQGRTILPGFIDSHFHLISFAESHVVLDLDPRNGFRTISEIQQALRTVSRELPSGEWIRAKRFDEFFLGEKRYLNRWDLDKATLVHPIIITHRSGHLHILNSIALRKLGISRKTPDPPGGLIDRDLDTGEPTGLLYEMGEFLSGQIPPVEAKELENAVQKASQQLLSLGITSLQDASVGNDKKRWKLLKTWKEKGILHQRINMMLGVRNLSEYSSYDFRAGLNLDQLRINCVKIILDETTGLLYPEQSKLNELVLEIHNRDLQVAIHAIEERAIESACAAIEYALGKKPKLNHRHRIEHCAVCPPSLAKRIASLGIRVVTHPSFIYYSGDRYLETIQGHRLRYLYPLSTLIQNGVIIAGGSDCPVSPPNPLLALYGAVSRMSETSKSVVPSERIPMIEALQMYTRYAAEASFDEETKGSIAPGKLADLVVLNGDPAKVAPQEVKNLEIEMTILDGEVVWEKEI